MNQSETIAERPQTERGEHRSWWVVWRAFRIWWRKRMNESVDQEKVVAKIRDESGLTPRYVFMTAMSAGIAVLGLLLSSPAVVIGAMLLSPLMGPIIGAGFALAIGDVPWLKECSKSLLAGTLIAVLFCALIVILSPLQSLTEEIAARTRPNLFDLGVAFFSALAGSYAMIRGREGTIVGVAIATALMPPLAVVGYGLATGNSTVFGGSLMLFVTNLLTIALTAAIMARFYGFRSTLSSRQSMWQNIGILVSFVILAIPLGASLRQIAWEANASRQISGFIQDEFAGKSRVSQLDIDFDSEPIRIAATVLTPEFRPEAVARSTRSLQRALGQPVSVTIDQFRVGTDPRAAEEAQLAAAKAQEQAAATQRQIAQVGERMALIAGVSPNDVLIDRERRRAMVRARPLPGTSLAGYWELEQRVAGGAPGWTIEIVPPARPLPDIAFGADDEPTSEGLAATALIGWAAERLDLPVALSGSEERVERIAALLGSRNIAVQRSGTRTSSPDSVEASWANPAED